MVVARLRAEMYVKSTDRRTHARDGGAQVDQVCAVSGAYTGGERRLLFEVIETDLAALQTQFDQVGVSAIALAGNSGGVMSTDARTPCSRRERPCLGAY